MLTQDLPAHRNEKLDTGLGRAIRHDWSVAEVVAIYSLPLFSLIDRARQVHLAFQDVEKVQLCTLLSVKTGGCAEDCGYCPQSSHYEGGVQAERMLDLDDVLAKAGQARQSGATRFCMGAAWREAKDGPAFDRVLTMVRGVKALGLETCCTLGMLTDDQVVKLRDAGLDAYNHNLDTSRAAYRSIVSTRTYDERLATLDRVQKAGIRVCSGGIIGMGETREDRCAMLVELARMQPHPESVPVNVLVRAPGTPLADAAPIDPLDLVRMVATARVVFPRARVRLSAGRTEMPREVQLLCLYAGANSMFYGEKLLTTSNPEEHADLALLRDAGLTPEHAIEQDG